jgi:DNA-binding transcriptional LysR family regulator
MALVGSGRAVVGEGAVEIDPKRLLVLREIADGGGIAAASRALGHTPSAISQQLARLEQEVGVPLVDRSQGRAELTAAGRLLAGYGRRIGGLLDEAAGELGAFTGRASGPVHIGASAPAVTFFAGTAVHVLAERNPRIQPRLGEAGTEDGLAALRCGDLDLLVMEDDQDAPVPLPAGVVATVLAQDRYQLVLPESWTVPEDPAELSGRPWIGAPAGSPRDLAFQRLAAQHGIEPSLVHMARHRFAVYTMLSVRLGAAILPSNAAGLLTHGVVTALPVPGVCLIRLLRRTGPSAPVPAVEAAAEALHTALLMAIEGMVSRGMVTGEPRVAPRLLDPSQEQRGS